MSSTKKIRGITLDKLKQKFKDRQAADRESSKIGPKIPKNIDLNAIEKRVRRATRKDVDASLKWFYDEIKGELGKDGRAKSRIRRIPDKAFSPAKDAFIGGLFFYYYDPKTKEQMNYWDTFPLVVPIEIYGDGFLGLNLHYLPPMLRARLLDGLMKYKRRAATPRAYMKVSYRMLKGVIDSKLFQPCIHRYLTSHITTKIVKVSDEYWDRAAMLPVQNFKGARAKDIWSGKAGPQRKTKSRR